MLGKIQNDYIPSGLHSGKLTWLAGKWTRIEGVFPVENGEILLLYWFTKGYMHMSVVLRKKTGNHLETGGVLVINWSYMM